MPQPNRRTRLPLHPRTVVAMDTLPRRPPPHRLPPLRRRHPLRRPPHRQLKPLPPAQSAAGQRPSLRSTTVTTVTPVASTYRFPQEARGGPVIGPRQPLCIPRGKGFEPGLGLEERQGGGLANTQSVVLVPDRPIPWSRGKSRSSQRPTMPTSQSSKIGSSGFSLSPTTTLALRTPAMWVAFPLIPTAM